MRDFINDLTGGFFRRKTENTESNNKESDNEEFKNISDEDIGGHYDVYMQFDEDTPIKIFSDIDNMDSVQFEIFHDSTNDDELYFMCEKSGKKFKIYTKSQNKNGKK